MDQDFDTGVFREDFMWLCEEAGVALDEREARWARHEAALRSNRAYIVEAGPRFLIPRFPDRPSETLLAIAEEAAIERRRYGDMPPCFRLLADVEASVEAGDDGRAATAFAALVAGMVPGPLETVDIRRRSVR